MDQPANAAEIAKDVTPAPAEAPVAPASTPAPAVKAKAPTPTPKAKVPDKPKHQPHKGDNAVLERARRLAKQMVGQERAKLAKAIGMPEYDPKTFDAKIEEMLTTQVAGMSEAQKMSEDTRATRAENNRLKAENNKLRREAVQATRAKQNIQTTSELREQARQAGIQDPEYALHLLASQIKKTGSADVEPAEFFTGLKKSHGHIFKETVIQAGPSSGAPQTPSSTQPNAPTTGHQGAPPKPREGV